MNLIKEALFSRNFAVFLFLTGFEGFAFKAKNLGSRSLCSHFSNTNALESMLETSITEIASVPRLWREGMPGMMRALQP